jgi:hypothetical protein
MIIYIVDTNFFIQAHRSFYPLDVAVGFWDRVRLLADEGKIISIDKVRAEIYKNDDELKQWCELNLPAAFFHSTKNISIHYSNVINWANDKRDQYTLAALTQFMDIEEADPWLVSYAISTGFTVVTQEESAPQSKKSIKIPDVCQVFNVQYLKPIDMFRNMGQTF